MSEEDETQRPEFRVDTLETLGQCLKVATSLDPDQFPYIVKLPKSSKFFQDAYRRVYLGHKGSNIEHTALLAANDVGEIMISSVVLDGTESRGLTEANIDRYIKLRQRLKLAPVPPGHRAFGHIHSHPWVDVANTALNSLMEKIPGIGNIPATWSMGDFLSFLHDVKNTSFTTLGLISPVSIAFLVGSKATKDLLMSPHKAYEIIMRRTPNVPQPLRRMKQDTYKFLLGISGEDGIAEKLGEELLLPPYQAFEELGIIQYSGGYVGGGKNGEIVLKRF